MPRRRSRHSTKAQVVSLGPLDQTGMGCFASGLGILLGLFLVRDLASATCCQVLLGLGLVRTGGISPDVGLRQGDLITSSGWAEANLSSSASSAAKSFSSLGLSYFASSRLRATVFACASWAACCCRSGRSIFELLLLWTPLSSAKLVPRRRPNRAPQP